MNFIYCRVSSKEQAEGFSLDAQLDLLKKYAEEKNIPVPKENIILEDESSKEGMKRKKFVWMVRLIEKTTDKHQVICEKTDRLHRNLKDAERIDDLVRRGKLIVHFVKEHEVYDTNSTSHTRLIRGFKSLLARFYWENLREECIKGTTKKIERGEYPGYAPIGYVNNIITGKIELDPKRAPLIKRMFVLFASDKYSYESLADEMRREGLTIRTQKKSLRDAGVQERPITVNNIERTLQQPFYYGWFKWFGKLWSNQGINQDREPTYPPLISKALFESVQEVRKKHAKGKSRIGQRGRKRTKEREREPIFQGKLTCAYCDCSLSPEVQKKKYVYYSCTNGKKSSDPNYYKDRFGQPSCIQPNWNEDIIIEAIEQAINEIEFNEEVFDMLKERIGEEVKIRQSSSAEELKILNKRLAKLISEEDQLVKAKHSGKIEKADLDSLERILNKIRKEKEEIENEVQEKEEQKEEHLDEGVETLKTAVNFLDYFKNLRKKEQKFETMLKQMNMIKAMFRTIQAGDFETLNSSKPTETGIIVPMRKNDKLNYNKSLAIFWNEPFNTLFDEKFMKEIEQIEQKSMKKDTEYARTDSNCRPSDS